MIIEPTVACYTQGEPFQAEKRSIFASAWLPVCHESQVAQPGDFAAQTIGGWPLFAMRGEDEAIRVFRNVCRHQGMQVVEKASGQCNALRCRYHGWTYDLAGKFVTAPDNVAPADRFSPGNNLQQVRSTDVLGFVLCTLSPAPTAIEPFAPARVPSAAPAGSVVVEIAANWKTCLEHVLRAENIALLWPLLVAERVADGAIVTQIVPRTFLRTRVVLHAFSGAGSALQTHADDMRRACEALQQERAAGVMPEREGGIAALWDRVHEALATDTPPS